MRYFCLFMLLLFSCQPKKTYQITGKWIGYQPIMKGIFCENCDPALKGCCMMTYQDSLYKRTDSYVLNEDGQIDSIYNYDVPLGVNIYSLEEYLEFMVVDSLEKITLTTTKVYWEEGKLIDNDDIITDFENDMNNKCFVYRKENRIVLYEYEDEK